MVPIWRAKDLGRVKINEFDYAVAVYDDIGALEIPVHDPIRVEVSQAFQNLFHYALDMLGLEDDSAAVLWLPYEITQVDGTVLQREVEETLQMEDVMKLDNIGMVELLQKFDLS